MTRGKTLSCHIGSVSVFCHILKLENAKTNENHNQGAIFSCSRLAARSSSSHGVALTVCARTFLLLWSTFSAGNCGGEERETTLQSWQRGMGYGLWAMVGNFKWQCINCNFKSLNLWALLNDFRIWANFRIWNSKSSKH